MQEIFPNTSPSASRRRILLSASLLLFAILVVAIIATGSAPAATVAEKQDALTKILDEQNKVQAEIDSRNKEIDGLVGEVSRLKQAQEKVRAKLDAKQAELDKAVAELKAEQQHLRSLRKRLQRSMASLNRMLVGIYKSGQPDFASALVSSAGMSQMISESEYLDQINNYQDAVISRVHSLRDESKNAVARMAVARDTIAKARNEIARHEQEVTAAKDSIQSQWDSLVAARASRKSALASLGERRDSLEKDLQKAAEAAGVPVPTDGSVVNAPAPIPGQTASIVNGQAVAPAGAPDAVKNVIAAANSIATTPYVWGGGHGAWESSGYDCSGSVSFALHGGGLLDSPLDSTGLTYWGEAGPGNWITVYGNSGHVYAVIAGLRWDTSMTGGNGPRWSTELRDNVGFISRHPGGL